MTAHADHATLINVFTVQPERARELADLLTAATEDVMQHIDGFISANIHLSTDGTRVVWEYPRASPDGDQMDFTEVMEIRDGRIAHHRVYWGWKGVGILRRGEHES